MREERAAGEAKSVPVSFCKPGGMIKKPLARVRTGENIGYDVLCCITFKQRVEVQQC